MYDYEIDMDIDTFQVFDDIIKHYGSIYTIDDDIDKQPRLKGVGFYHMTFEDIANKLGVTRERVRQIEQKDK